ncbi:hypothetical protein IP97_00129 [Flavobacterium cheniae]|jgi:hypothetical protein|uniref:Uncharacterized protein n=1 Tax=Flavobacterium cheniae TaxID=295428 RepID=A0A562KSK8_9FLAO|nr:hypothetical protein C8D80_0406 [Flavobacterium cheniae]TWH98183.1 hypothetical protein IP97_00129 [Flavobacterium cheniae]
MVSFKECKKILNKKGVKYSDENIREIKELLEFYAKLTVEEFYKKNDYEKSSHNVSCK